MHNNGISHTVAADDFDGVNCVLEWLSYIPNVNSIIILILISCLGKWMSFTNNTYS